MMQIIGDSYISQHIRQEIDRMRRERAYRAYVTDALYAISSGDRRMTVRWADIDPGILQEVRRAESAAEIKARVMQAVNEGRQTE